MPAHTTGGRRNADERSRYQGQWFLADGHLRLLSIGARLFHGTSLRSGMDLVARRTLWPLMQSAIGSGAPAASVAVVDNRHWTARAIPVRGALSGRPLAVLGCYAEREDDVPTPPKVGSWEWAATPPSPGQVAHTYWSPEMPAVFGIGAEESASWEGPQWLDEFVYEGDRPNLRAMWVRLLADEDPLLRICSFVATPPTGERYAVRATGRRRIEDGKVFLHGIAMRLPDGVEPNQSSHIGPLLALSGDPICLIDPNDEVIYMTSGAFSSLGLNLPNSRHLPAMCHAEDLTSLRELFRYAADNVGNVWSPVFVRLASTAGRWSKVEISGTAVRLSAQSTHVWCRVRGLAA